jgi:hypothetical protein
MKLRYVCRGTAFNITLLDVEIDVRSEQVNRPITITGHAVLISLLDKTYSTANSIEHVCKRWKVRILNTCIIGPWETGSK